MEEDLARFESGPLSTCSETSLLPHCSSEERDIHQNDLKIENADTENKNGRARKLLQKYNLLIPELKTKKVNNAKEKVDLALPSDTLDPWLIRKFPTMKKKAETLEASPEKEKKSVPARRRIKEDLLAKMAVKRKMEQERRKELYMEDNEDLLAAKEDEENEIEEEKEKTKKKTKLKAKKPVGSDDEENEDDEDYVAEEINDEEETNSDEEADDEENNDAEQQTDSPRNSLKESVDVFDIQASPSGIILDSMPNIFKHSQTAVASQFPTSLTQWYLSDVDTQKEESFMDEEEAVAEDLAATVNKEPVNNDDLLAFCSGQFEPPAAVIPKPKEVHLETNEENDEIVIHSSKKKKRIIDSDDEEEQENGFTSEHDEEDEDAENDEEETVIPKKKLVIEEADEDDDDKFDEEEEQEDEEEEVDDQAGQEGNDSDDELAVIRRLENQDYKRKLKKKKFLDDEASLSGSDVGSDIDEDDAENDDYEADECDKEIFDQEDLRNKNHKLYLKLQEQQTHRDIAKLQDRLLADGDLAGVETNRSFRVRLREDIEINMDEINADTQDSLLPEEENPEEDKKRIEAIKFRAEMHNALSQLQEEPVDDDIERAARAAELLEVSEYTEHTESVTLIGKTPLSTVFKDVNGPVTVRQMYTTTIDVGSAPCKRPSGAIQIPSKKQKLTLFDALDD